MGRRRNSAVRNWRRREKKRISKAQSCFPNIILPEDIVVQILSRLPLKSLIRFTCVSKQWHFLIYGISATKTGSPMVLLVSYSRAHSFSPLSIDQHQQEIHMENVHVPWNMNESNMHGSMYEIIYRFLWGSCNGLLLMSIGEDVFLWNPLTRFFKKVLSYDRLGDEDYRVCPGLCYDSTSGEYKAVLALAHLTPEWGGEFVVVGSFRSKTWTEIDFPYMSSTVNSGPIVNGNLHWFASKNDSYLPHFLSPHQIIYFNAHMDKFEEVPMPDPRAEDGDIIFGLGVLDGCLCMCRSDNPGNSESNADVLIMKEYGVKNSWSILFVVSDDRLTFNPYDTLVPLGCTKDGEVLTKVELWKDHSWHIRAFNLTNNFHEEIGITVDRYVSVIAHEQSLITPTDYGWEEEELKGEATYLEVEESRSRSRKMNKGKDGRWHEEPNLKEF